MIFNNPFTLSHDSVCVCVTCNVSKPRVITFFFFHFYDFALFCFMVLSGSRMRAFRVEIFWGLGLGEWSIISACSWSCLGWILIYSYCCWVILFLYYILSGMEYSGGSVDVITAIHLCLLQYLYLYTDIPMPCYTFHLL